MKNADMNHELQERSLEISSTSTSEDSLGSQSQQGVNARNEQLPGVFENQQQAAITLLLMCGLLLVIGLYFQTEDIIHKEGIAATALILLLCWIRIISKPIKSE